MKDEQSSNRNFLNSLIKEEVLDRWYSYVLFPRYYDFTNTTPPAPKQANKHRKVRRCRDGKRKM